MRIKRNERRRNHCQQCNYNEQSDTALARHKTVTAGELSHLSRSTERVSAAPSTSDSAKDASCSHASEKPLGTACGHQQRVPRVSANRSCGADSKQVELCFNHSKTTWQIVVKLGHDGDTDSCNEWQKQTTAKRK